MAASEADFTAKFISKPGKTCEQSGMTIEASCAVCEAAATTTFSIPSLFLPEGTSREPVSPTPQAQAASCRMGSSSTPTSRMAAEISWTRCRKLTCRDSTKLSGNPCPSWLQSLLGRRNLSWESLYLQRSRSPAGGQNRAGGDHCAAAREGTALP